VARLLCLVLALAACGDDDGMVASDAGMADAGMLGGDGGACAALDFEAEATPAGDGVFEVSATTLGAPSAHDGTCAEVRGPELVYRWTADADVTVELTLSGPDPLLYVREGSCEGEELACNDDHGEDTLDSRVRFEATAGTDYYFFADSFDAEEAGPFTLTLDTGYEPLSFPEGTWLSRGYGYGLEVEGESVVVYEVTSLSCVAILEGRETLESILASTDHEGDLFTIRPEGSLTEIVFDREPLPDTCAFGTAVPGDPGYEYDPLFTWDVMDAHFREHYAHFERRGVDWDDRSAHYRGMLDDGSDEDTLFETMGALLRELGDGHVFLTDGTRSIDSYPFPILAQLEAEHAEHGTGSVGDYVNGELVRWLGVVDDEYLQDVERDENLAWGRLRDDVGYVSLLEVTPATITGADLDAILGELEDTHTLVLDLRVNTGGNDTTSVEIAARFARERTRAFSKHAVDGDGETTPLEVHVEPDGDRYEGRVLLLTSASTVSAAEILVLLMRELPQVTVMGQPTNGALSDVLQRTLPTGWGVSLSNETYVAADGEVYEGRGIPPDVVVEGDLFARDDRLAGVDRALDAVVAWLDTNPPE